MRRGRPQLVLGIVAVMAALAVLGGGATATQEATPITSCTNITESGTYVLQNDVATEGEGACIGVRASDVVIDGNGHEIEGAGLPGTVGVAVRGDDVTVQDVTVTNFRTGIRFSRSRNGVVTGVTATLNEFGVQFDRSDAGTVTDSRAVRNSDDGISTFGGTGMTIRGNVVSENSGDGIWVNSGGTVTDNVARGGKMIVRNVDPGDRTVVRNNTAADLRLFIARTGTVAENDVGLLLISSVWNASVVDNDVANQLIVREANDTVVANNTVGNELRLSGGFRGMSGTDQRRVCSQGLVVRDTRLTGPDAQLEFRDNTTGAIVHNVTLGTASVSLVGSEEVTVTASDTQPPNGDATVLSGSVRVDPAETGGVARLALGYDTGAVDESEAPLVWRDEGGGEWAPAESYTRTGPARVGTTVRGTEPTVLAAVATDSGTAEEYRVDAPEIEVTCTAERERVTVVNRVEETDEDDTQRDDGLPLVLMGGVGVGVALLAGLVLVGRRWQSGESGDGGPASRGPGAATASPGAGDGAPAAAAAGAVAGAETTDTPVVGVENEAFDRLQCQVRVRTDAGVREQTAFDLAGGERATVAKAPTDAEFEVAVAIEGGPTEAAVFEPRAGSDVRVRVSHDRVAIAHDAL